jgi:hypothetical protein
MRTKSGRDAVSVICLPSNHLCLSEATSTLRAESTIFACTDACAHLRGPRARAGNIAGVSAMIARCDMVGSPARELRRNGSRKRTYHASSRRARHDTRYVSRALELALRVRLTSCPHEEDALSTARALVLDRMDG